MPRSKTTDKPGKSSQKDRSQKNDEFREAFELFDHNKNGCIEPNELRVVMETLGYKPSDTELRDMINEADMDGNCMIDFDEFVRLVENQKKFREHTEDEELKEAFKVFDCDGNGYISRDELSKVMTNIGEVVTEQDVTDMILEADKNGDGLIDYPEFVELLSKK